MSRTKRGSVKLSGKVEFLPYVEIVPSKIGELLTSSTKRQMVADRIEGILSTRKFGERFTVDGGGVDEELERVSRWLEWRTEPPAYLLAEAWQDENHERAEILSRWLLLKGTANDRKPLKGLAKKLPVEVFAPGYSMPNPPTKHLDLSDPAIVLALKACDVRPPPLGKNQYSRTPAAQMGEFLMEASFKKSRSLKSKEDSARKILKNLGFAGDLKRR